MGNKWKWWQLATRGVCLFRPFLAFVGGSGDFAGKCFEGNSKWKRMQSVSNIRISLWNIPLMWVIIYICVGVIPKLFDFFLGKSAVGKSADLEGSSRNKWQLGWQMAVAKRENSQSNRSGMEWNQKWTICDSAGDFYDFLSIKFHGRNFPRGRKTKFGGKWAFSSSHTPTLTPSNDSQLNKGYFGR